MEGLVAMLPVTMSSWQGRGCCISAKAKDSPLLAHHMETASDTSGGHNGESGFRRHMICCRLSPSCPAKLGCMGVRGVAWVTHLCRHLYFSCPGDKGPTSVGTAGTRRMSLKLPCGHGILLASPREKGLCGQGHGFKAMAPVRCSFLLLSSFSSYIPACFWSLRAGDTPGRASRSCGGSPPCE